LDIAFASILIILIITPGLLLFSGFFSAPFTKELLPKNPVNDLINSIVPSVFLHVVYLILIEKYSDYYIDFPLLGNLLFQTEDPKEIKKSFDNISSHLQQIVCYHLCLWIASYLLGHLLRAIIRWFKLDTRWRPFRFNNHWHYLLSGEITWFPNVKLRPLTFVEFIIIDLSVATDAETIIYTGILQEYTLNNNGDLDTVTLSHTLRRPISAVRKKEANKSMAMPIEPTTLLGPHPNLEEATEDHKDKYWIPGNLFVLPYCKVNNINIRYITAKHSNREKNGVKGVSAVRKIFSIFPKKIKPVVS
jgi:hypothetical protein